MKIYTKTGDTGETGLFAGPRVRKDNPRIEAYGEVDELNAVLGLARCEPLPPAIEQTLAAVQNELFAVGAELATPDPVKMGTAWISGTHVAALEQAIDELETHLPPLRQFILPAGNRGACTIHIARGVCRRAERRLVTLANEPNIEISELLIRYLNRLSDYLFVAARATNVLAGEKEIPWQKP
ncbi:cob(I)yrinic acid a,c-diamide adenosyltransferase [Anatilimnocola floriformis]|uniref:cob(I)yrinic acid a,c-diamide adenosyltransferase n=1 Tax=Anatilimnocola floriformis TaxID=2948575 RepID=UPI0020C58984|nr:cob(I)yrinic acid a,c-diamide adenosyltransferase [Anatilimnocola floriformis]